MGQEIEYKLRAESAVALDEAFLYLQSCGTVSKPRTITMHTRYYDTGDRMLRRKRWTLRIRQENDRQVLTVKTPGTDHCRGEWEHVRDTDALFPERHELAQLVTEGAPEEILALPALSVACQARFTRRCCILTMADGTTIELAADVGWLEGREQHEAFFELELELLGGRMQTLEWLAERVSLPEEPRSKAARAMELL